MVANAKVWDSVDKKMYDACISDVHDQCTVLKENGQVLFGRMVNLDDLSEAGFTIYPG